MRDQPVPLSPFFSRSGSTPMGTDHRAIDAPELLIDQARVDKAPLQATKDFVEQNNSDSDHGTNSNQTPIDVRRDHTFRQRRDQPSLWRGKRIGATTIHAFPIASARTPIRTCAE